MCLQSIATWRKGREEEQSKNSHGAMATQWKPICMFYLHSLKHKSREEHCLSELPGNYTSWFNSFIHLSIYQAWQRGKTHLYVQGQTSIRRICCARICSCCSEQHTVWDQFLVFIQVEINTQKAVWTHITEFNPSVDIRVKTHGTFAVLGGKLTTEQDSNAIWMSSLPQHWTECEA